MASMKYRGKWIHYNDRGQYVSLDHFVEKENLRISRARRCDIVGAEIYQFFKTGSFRRRVNYSREDIDNGKLAIGLELKDKEGNDARLFLRGCEVPWVLQELGLGEKDLHALKEHPRPATAYIQGQCVFGLRIW